MIGVSSGNDMMVRWLKVVHMFTYIIFKLIELIFVIEDNISYYSFQYMDLAIHMRECPA
jgi:hypothetical protein